MERIIKTYDNGLRLVVEGMPNFKSVTFNVMVSAGSGDELPNEQGLSHFCEHMMFKGTKKRLGKEIIDELSKLSVDYNAWTSECATCYHTKGVSGNLEQCMDILSDMYFNLKFTEEDFNKEGDVIVQEIAMYADSPTSTLFELTKATYFKNTKYEHPVAGFAKEIKRYKPEDIYNYIKKHYIASNTIISIAGDITMERAETLVKKYFLKNYAKTKATPKLPTDSLIISPSAVQIKKKKDTEQQHVALVFPVCNQFDESRYALGMLVTIFAGDMSSRLFINVREKAGLVYSIHGVLELSDIGGYLAIMFSCTPKNTKKVIETVSNEIDILIKDGITEDEIKKAKNFRYVRKMFESESTLKVNDRNSDELREYGKIRSTDEYIKLIESIKKSDVEDIAKKYLDKCRMSTIIVGK